MTISGMMCLRKQIHAWRTAMKRFLKRHEDRISGTIAGFDRVLFRGNLSSICHLEGMDKFLSSQRVLYKDFKPFVEKVSNRVKEQAKQMAAAEQRPYLYLTSSQGSKEERARQIMERDQINEGLDLYPRLRGAVLVVWN